MGLKSGQSESTVHSAFAHPTVFLHFLSISFCEDTVLELPISLELAIAYNQEGSRYGHGQGSEGWGGVKMACIGHQYMWVIPRGG